MRVVYADTGAWIALIWSRDRDHERVSRHYEGLSKAGDRVVTVDLAVAETATRLRYDAGLPLALAFRGVIADAVARGRLTIRYSDESLHEKAWALMERFSDQRLSFTDCAGAVTAREARAAAVLALDADFSILGFPLEP